MLGGERLQIRQASHRPVLIQHFANDANFSQPREPAEIDAAFGVPRANEHAAGPGDQSIDVPLIANEIVNPTRRIGADANRPAAVAGGDPRADSRACVEIVGERRCGRVEVNAGKQRETEAIRVSRAEVSTTSLAD